MYQRPPTPNIVLDLQNFSGIGDVKWFLNKAMTSDNNSTRYEDFIVAELIWREKNSDNVLQLNPKKFWRKMSNWIIWFIRVCSTTNLKQYIMTECTHSYWMTIIINIFDIYILIHQVNTFPYF